MPSTSLFQYTRLRTRQKGWQGLRKQLTEQTLPALAPAGARLWGAWFGLFGLASNELMLITSWPNAVNDAAARVAAALPGDAETVQQLELSATVRPLDDTQRTRQGLYVFRFFDVLHRDVDEVAALSQQAWTSFETTDAYRAEPQALFCERGRDGSEQRGVMLLLTWYDGFESWQTSRQPHPEAAANFRRRAELTLGTVAYATRLAE